MEFESFVLAAVTTDLAEEPKAREAADALEFRMDLTSGDPLGHLQSYTGDLPIIATNRVESEGGEAVRGSARIDTLCTAAEHESVRAVDIELESVRNGAGRRLVDHAYDHGAKVIVSTHDFDTTPPIDSMHRMLTAAGNIGDVAKLSTTATTTGEALDLLTVTHEQTETGATVATMAMGEHGRHTRALAPIYGSRIGYAPVEPSNATAPGQYDLSTLAFLIDNLT